MKTEIESKVLTKLLDENIVTRSEMLEAMDKNTKEIMKETKGIVEDIKSSNRWTVGTVISIISISIAVVSLVLHAL